jgi:hypothetical protein
MADIKAILISATMLLMGAPFYGAGLAYGETNEGSASVASQVKINGVEGTSCWKQLDGESLQLLWPTATGETKNFTVRADEVLCEMGSLVSAALSDGKVAVVADFAVGNSTVRRTYLVGHNLEVWLSAPAGQGVAYRAFKTLQANAVYSGEEVVLVNKSDIDHFSPYRAGEALPDYSALVERPATPQPQFPVAKKAPASQQGGGFKIVSGSTKAEKRTAKARKAAAAGARVTRRFVSGD